jgi:exonuclease III
MSFCTWNVRSLYRAGSLTAAARELARYKFDIVGVQEVMWDKEDNIKVDLQQVGCGGMDWIGLAEDTDRWRAILNAVMNLRVQKTRAIS